jgi:hypothetical protein
VRILVAGRVARDPDQGGAAWAVMQYVLGFQRLGHDVKLVEPIAEPSAESAMYFNDTCRWFGVNGEIASTSARFPDFELVLNISGLLSADSIAGVPIRVYLDLDPAFNQAWHERGIDRGFDGHTHFATVGQGIGVEPCEVPTLSREWIHILPPVVLDEWRDGEAIGTDAFTTVANLRSYGSLEHGGVHLGQKIHSLRTLTNLPRRTHAHFIIAATTHRDERKDLEALENGGWTFVDPVAASGTPAAYREFIRGSRAEIGIAKSGYVTSRSGWFSDRSACYLAAGRPVVAQDTGYSSALPTGEGLLPFNDEDSAVAAVAEVTADYARHSKSARELAVEWLDSDRVLARLLRDIGA